MWSTWVSKEILLSLQNLHTFFRWLRNAKPKIRLSNKSIRRWVSHLTFWRGRGVVKNCDDWQWICTQAKICGCWSRLMRIAGVECMSLTRWRSCERNYWNIRMRRPNLTWKTSKCQLKQQRRLEIVSNHLNLWRCWKGWRRKSRLNRRRSWYRSIWRGPCWLKRGSLI